LGEFCDVRLQGLSRQASISSEPGNDAMRDPRLRADSFLAGLASGFGGSTSASAAAATAAPPSRRERPSYDDIDGAPVRPREAPPDRGRRRSPSRSPPRRRRSRSRSAERRRRSRSRSPPRQRRERPTYDDVGRDVGGRDPSFVRGRRSRSRSRPRDSPPRQRRERPSYPSDDEREPKRRRERPTYD
jgi:hypothetical protein